MKVFRKLFANLIRIRFQSPSQSEVIILYQAGSRLIAEMILKDIPHCVMDIENGAIYISPKIIMGMLRRFQIMKNEQAAFRSVQKRLRFIAGLLLRIYYLSCLDSMRPKVILTYLDNSYNFQWMSRRYPEAVFLAIQNGVRLPSNMRTCQSVAPHPASIISMPHYFCFGEFEKDLHRKYGHHIDHYYPVGSLRAGYYRSELAESNPSIRFDLCLIVTGQWPNEITPTPSEIRQSAVILHNFLKRYIVESGATLCVALRTMENGTEEYFKQFFGKDIHVTRLDRAVFTAKRESMATFFAIDQSIVAITRDSTAGVEAFGWGKKVLFCNFSGNDDYDFPCSGPWFIKRADYSLFKKHIEDLRVMSKDEYQKVSSEAAQYLMNLNEEFPAHKVIRERILQCLNFKSQY